MVRYIVVFADGQYDFANAEVMLYVTPDMGHVTKTFYLTEFPFGDELENNVCTNK